MRVIRLALAALAGVTMADTASAQGAGSHAGPVEGRPSHSEIWTTPEAQHVDFRTESGWDAVANRYGDALQFARCAARLDPEGTSRIIARPIGHDDERRAMQQLATRYRTCVGSAGAVAPLLIRAAVAEAMLLGPKTLRTSDAASVGVPGLIDGCPVGRIAACQAREAPALVVRLFSTRPGSADERRAADAIVSAAPRCGGVLRRMHPTAARLALVEAVAAGR